MDKVILQQVIKEFWIYKITNIITGKFYVGQTVNLYNRLKSHKACRDKKSIIVKSIEKYGWENHVVSILFNTKNISRTEADEVEIFYIKKENSFVKNNKLGMNLTEGGLGGNIQKPTMYIKRSFNNYKKWKEKLGKAGVDVLLFTIKGNYVDKFDGIDFVPFLNKHKIIFKNHNWIKRNLQKKSWGIVNNKYIIGFEDVNPYEKYLELLKRRSEAGKNYTIKNELIEKLNKHREINQQIPILDLNTGIYFETMTEFCKQEQRSFATIRERFEKGKYVGKYMMCKN